MRCFPGSRREERSGRRRRKISDRLLALAGDVAQVLEVPDSSGKMLRAPWRSDPAASGVETESLRTNGST